MSLLQLPPDALRLIAQYQDLPVRDIISFCRANRRLNETICMNDRVWEYLFRRRLSGVAPFPPTQKIKEDLHRLDEADAQEAPELSYWARNGYEIPIRRWLPGLTSSERL